MNILKKIRRRRRRLAPVSVKTRAGPGLAELLKLFDVDLVIDVGANVGQFATKLRRQDFTGAIFSIEPLSSAHAQLYAAAQGDPLWEVAPRMATGERDGEVEINVSENSVSSSVRPWHEALPFLRRDDDSDTARQLRYVSRERVPIRRLSTVYRDHELARFNKTFVKMDVQGYERDVLDGASDIISDIVGIHIEMPTTCMYQGQDLEPDDAWRNRGDSQELGFLIHHDGWSGGQHGWRSLIRWICVYRYGYRLTGAALRGGQAAFVSVFPGSFLMPSTKAAMGVRPFMPRPWCGRSVL